MQLLFPNPPFRFIGSDRIYLLKNIDPDTQQILAATSSPLFLGLPFVICYGGGAWRRCSSKGKDNGYNPRIISITRQLNMAKKMVTMRTLDYKRATWDAHL